jgi:lipopolysaccharide heptosyltransferase II
MRMDKDTLAQRNRALTEAYHQRPLKYALRDQLLRAAAAIPLPARPAQRERVLLIRPDHLGDVLLATPAFGMLREALPGVELHALVGPWSSDILEGNRDLDQVLTLSFPGFRRTHAGHVSSPYRQAITDARRLRRIGYSAALILRPDHWWGAMLARWAGIPRRIGFDLPGMRPWLTDCLPFPPAHAVQHNALLAAYLAGIAAPGRDELTLRLRVQPADAAALDAELQQRGIAPARPIIVLHAGAGAAVKLWTEDSWRSVCSALMSEHQAVLVLTGSDAEAPLAARLAAAAGPDAHSLAGETDVRTLAALIRRALLALGPDSGPLHMAAALGTPSVALYGPADPLEFGPWGSAERHRAVTSSIACRPCRILDWRGDALENHPCVRDITPAAVLDAARRAIAAGRA